MSGNDGPKHVRKPTKTKDKKKKSSSEDDDVFMESDVEIANESQAHLQNTRGTTTESNTIPMAIPCVSSSCHE